MISHRLLRERVEHSTAMRTKFLAEALKRKLVTRNSGGLSA
jgi:hypothetical protein